MEEPTRSEKSKRLEREKLEKNRKVKDGREKKWWICRVRTGTVASLLLSDIKSFNEFWKQMVPPKGTQVDCCPYTCTQYNQFLFAPDGKFHTVGPTHYNTFLQVEKKLSSHIGRKESAPGCFLQCFTFFNVPIKWGCNILLVWGYLRYMILSKSRLNFHIWKA